MQKSYLFSDAHAHLDDTPTPSKLVKEAKLQGIERIFSNSVDLASAEKLLSLAKENKEIKPCFGLHPVNLLQMQENEIRACLEFVKKHAKNSSGIGEIGLDYKHAESAEQKLLQEKIFLQQIQFAQEFGKSVSIHSRKSKERILEILSEQKPERILMHWFISNSEMLEKFLKLGCFFSVGPSVLYYSDVKKFAQKLPLENLVLETD
ncbi:MAG: TatD family hydrolase, partial [Candidatus Diapherotrites archaeon]|nr:TatD family hydrolase [Candidatus Diapherotrites archaeon]